MTIRPASPDVPGTFDRRADSRTDYQHAADFVDGTTPACDRANERTDQSAAESPLQEAIAWRSQEGGVESRPKRIRRNQVFDQNELLPHESRSTDASLGG